MDTSQITRSDLADTTAAAEPVAEAAEADPGRHPAAAFRRIWRSPLAVLAALTTVLVAVNLWWISAHRRGLPFNVDEAGYMQRAIRDSDALSAGGVTQLIHVVRGPDPQAPLLPVTAGVVHSLTGLNPYGLLGVVQVFAVVLTLATYLVARRVMSRNWAVLAAVVVLALPGIVDQSRGFGFAVPAAATVTAALAAQLGAADFRSTTRTVLWGALLGLATLSRTMVLGLAAALVFTALVRLVASGPDRRSSLNFAAGLAVGFLIAWSWYSASWHAVTQYLFSFGYGSNASAYGPAHPFWSPQWWTERLLQMLDTDVFLPLTAALAICLVVGIGTRIARRPAGPAERRELDHHHWGRRLRAWAVTDIATVVIFFISAYALLSSSRNSGWGFELPLLAPAVILILALVQRAPMRARRLAGAACCVAVAFSFIAQAGFLPGNSSVVRTFSLGPFHERVFDNRGEPLEYGEVGAQGCAALVGRLAGKTLPCTHYLQQWQAAVHLMTKDLWTDATARGRLPVVAFPTEDPFLNTNAVSLDYQLAHHDGLVSGVLEPPSVIGRSLLQQLEPPGLEPNLVVVGPASNVPSWRNFSPTTDPAPVVRALRRDGFTRIGRVTLPDSRVMGLWWKDRGPVVAPRSAS